MSPTAWLILVPLLCYAAAACIYAQGQNWPLVIVYSGYAWANLGLILIEGALRK